MWDDLLKWGPAVASLIIIPFGKILLTINSKLDMVQMNLNTFDLKKMNDRLLRIEGKLGIGDTPNQ